MEELLWSELLLKRDGMDIWIHLKCNCILAATALLLCVRRDFAAHQQYYIQILSAADLTMQ